MTAAPPRKAKSTGDFLYIEIPEGRKIMKKYPNKSLGILFAVFLLAGCGKKIIAHDVKKAGASALEFAEETFVRGEFKKGYALTAQKPGAQIDFGRFRQVIAVLHPKGYPLSVTAEGYEAAPDKDTVNVFVKGENGGEKFYYRLVMEGTGSTGYKVAGLYRGKSPYPGPKPALP